MINFDRSIKTDTKDLRMWNVYIPVVWEPSRREILYGPLVTEIIYTDQLFMLLGTFLRGSLSTNLMFVC